MVRVKCCTVPTFSLQLHEAIAFYMQWGSFAYRRGLWELQFLCVLICAGLVAAITTSTSSQWWCYHVISTKTPYIRIFSHKLKGFTKIRIHTINVCTKFHGNLSWNICWHVYKSSSSRVILLVCLIEFSHVRLNRNLSWNILLKPYWDGANFHVVKLTKQIAQLWWVAGEKVSLLGVLYCWATIIGSCSTTDYFCKQFRGMFVWTFVLRQLHSNSNCYRPCLQLLLSSTNTRLFH